MCPKQILIKSTSNIFLDILNNELKKIPSIRFFYYKANDIYTIVIKCSNYYNRFVHTDCASFYGSYIYLYTNISLLLSSLLIEHYESKLLRRAIKSNYFYFDNTKQTHIANITTSILDPNFPFEANRKLYLYRKEILLKLLLKNFRNKNYINVDAFINFSSEPYKAEVEAAVDKAVELYLLDINYTDLIKFILQNWLI